MPTISPRRRTGNALVKIVRLSGMTAAAPRPCTVRAAISPAVLGARAHAAEARVNSDRPMSKIRRLPNRSPSAAAVMMPAAKAMP